METLSGHIAGKEKEPKIKAHFLLTPHRTQEEFRKFEEEFDNMRDNL